MKKLYLLYNSIQDEYYFSTSSNPYSVEKRRTFKKKEVIQELKVLIDPKRKSLLSLVNINSSLVNEVETLFKKSRISLSIIDNLSKD
jgi:hypothetical protein